MGQGVDLSYAKRKDCIEMKLDLGIKELRSVKFCLSHVSREVVFFLRVCKLVVKVYHFFMDDAS